MSESKAQLQPLLLKPAEAAQLLNVGVSTVYDLAAKGMLPSIKIGKSVRIPKAELEAWLRERQQLARLS